MPQIIPSPVCVQACVGVWVCGWLYSSKLMGVLMLLSRGTRQSVRPCIHITIIVYYYSSMHTCVSGERARRIRLSLYLSLVIYTVGAGMDTWDTWTYNHTWVRYGYMGYMDIQTTHSAHGIHGHTTTHNMHIQAQIHRWESGNTRGRRVMSGGGQQCNSRRPALQQHAR